MTSHRIALLAPILLLTILGCPTSGVRAIGGAPANVRTNPGTTGYSIAYIDAVPTPGTALVLGENVAFSVTVEYRLEIAERGDIVLVFQGESDKILIHGRSQATLQVERGSGQVTLSDTLTLPPDVREVHLYVTLLPEGLVRSAGTILITYPVRKGP